jgi:hypothetical protein
MWEFLTSFFGSEATKATLGTFFGALIGIPAGLSLNHIWERRQDKDRRTELLSALRQAVDQNTYLIGQIEDWLTKGGYPYFNLDLPLLESTASLKY